MEPALHHAMMAAACSFLPRHQFAARTDSHLSNCRTALSKRTQTPENLDDSDLFAAALLCYVQTSDPNLFIVNSDVFLTIAQHIADPDPLLMDLWPLARDLVLEAAELSMQSDDTVLRLYERAQKIFGRRKFIDYRQYAWSMFPFDPAFESPDLFYFQITQLGRSLLWRLLRISWSIQGLCGDEWREPVGPVFSEISDFFRSDAIRNHSKGLLRLTYTDTPHRDCHIFASIQYQLCQLLVHIVECGSPVTSEEGALLARSVLESE
jgi:hypothetical protein